MDSECCFKATKNKNYTKCDITSVIGLEEQSIIQLKLINKEIELAGVGGGKAITIEPSAHQL